MLPIEVDDLTPAWFSEVLGRSVDTVTVLDRSSGTTGRARVELRGDAGTPPTVFVKLAPFDERQRAFVNMVGMGVAEARFYRDLAAEVPVRVPSVWFAATEGDDAYVMVLEDLVASGCRFPSPADADIEARATDIVDQLARLHAHYWESPRFAAGGDLAWLAPRGTGGEGGRKFVGKAVEQLGDQMDDDFHRIADIYLSRHDDIVALWNEGPATLVHGDPHMGNLFVDVAGGDRTGFLDWAVLGRAPGLRDVAYVLCNSVPARVREPAERALIERYCAGLAAGGVDLDPADAWDGYRLFSLYSWVAAASTAAMGSKWQPIKIGLDGTRRATAACTHLDCVGLLESRLA